jgi:hypothetical protein
MRRIAPLSAAVAFAFAAGWLLRPHEHRPPPGGTSRPPALFVTHPNPDGTRTVGALAANQVRGPAGVVEYAPADPDRDWHVEIDGVTYLCSPR